MKVQQATGWWSLVTSICKYPNNAELEQDSGHYTGIPSLTNVWIHKKHGRRRRCCKRSHRHRFPPSLFCSRAEDLWNTLMPLRVRCSCSSTSGGENCSRLSLAMPISDASLGSSQSSVPRLTASGLTDALGDTLANTHFLFELLITCMEKLMNRFIKKSSSSDLVDDSPMNLKALLAPESTSMKNWKGLNRKSCVRALSATTSSIESRKCRPYWSTGKIGRRKRRRSTGKELSAQKRRCFSSIEGTSSIVTNSIRISKDILSREEQTYTVDSKKALLSNYFLREIDVSNINKRLRMSEHGSLLNATQSDSRLKENKVIQFMEFIQTHKRGIQKHLLEQKARHSSTAERSTQYSFPNKRPSHHLGIPTRRVTFSNHLPGRTDSILKKRVAKSDTEADADSCSSAQSFATAMTSYSEQSVFECLYSLSKLKDSKSILSSSKSSRSSERVVKSAYAADCDRKISFISVKTQYSDPSFNVSRSIEDNSFPSLEKVTKSGRVPDRSSYEIREYNDELYYKASDNDFVLSSNSECSAIVIRSSISSNSDQSRSDAIELRLLEKDFSSCNKRVLSSANIWKEINASKSKKRKKALDSGPDHVVRSEFALKVVFRRAAREASSVNQENSFWCNSKNVTGKHKPSIIELEENCKRRKMSVECSRFSRTVSSSSDESPNASATSSEFIPMIPTSHLTLKHAQKKKCMKTVTFKESNSEMSSTVAEKPPVKESYSGSKKFHSNGNCSISFNDKWPLKKFCNSNSVLLQSISHSLNPVRASANASKEKSESWFACVLPEVEKETEPRCVRNTTDLLRIVDEAASVQKATNFSVSRLELILSHGDNSNTSDVVQADPKTNQSSASRIKSEWDWSNANESAKHLIRRISSSPQLADMKRIAEFNVEAEVNSSWSPDLAQFSTNQEHVAWRTPNKFGSQSNSLRVVSCPANVADTSNVTNVTESCIQQTSGSETSPETDYETDSYPELDAPSNLECDDRKSTLLERENGASDEELFCLGSVQMKIYEEERQSSLERDRPAAKIETQFIQWNHWDMNLTRSTGTETSDDLKLVSSFHVSTDTNDLSPCSHAHTSSQSNPGKSVNDSETSNYHEVTPIIREVDSKNVELEIPESREISTGSLKEDNHTKNRAKYDDGDDMDDARTDTGILEINATSHCELHSVTISQERLDLVMPTPCANDLEVLELTTLEEFPEKSSFNKISTVPEASDGSCNKITTSCLEGTSCPICSRLERPSTRYLLPACVVKGAGPKPQNEKDPWIRVMERVRIRPGQNTGKIVFEMKKTKYRQ